MRYLPYAILLSFGFAVAASATPPKGPWVCSGSGQKAEIPRNPGYPVRVHGPKKATEAAARDGFTMACELQDLKMCRINSCVQIP